MENWSAKAKTRLRLPVPSKRGDRRSDTGTNADAARMQERDTIPTRQS